eukprot:Nitzschia sp. Nitz4//scaffold10_size219509//144329//145619//NITZ4_001444-RA/size219509-processed-gene-0.88-mRNA-1//1//CDS//3329532968//9018//frame0
MADFDDQIEQVIPANIYMFAGASDSQQSTEVSNVKTFDLPDPAGKAGGACTSALLQTLYRDEEDDDIRYTWAETLELMREKIEEVGLNQEPQLSTSRPIDVNEELHIVPPDCDGTKRALIVGINYVGEANALSGCQKDARNVKQFLIDVCGFERENMLILMDDGNHHQPTKKMIEDGLTRLAEISQPGDCIFFQFSGHGGQMVDTSGDEDDGFDEILIPGDHRESGQIVDDWIYDEFVTKVKAGVHVVALIDCCHSGTAMDLPYVCNVGDGEIRRDAGFKIPASGTTLTPKKKEKESKKSKATSKDKKTKKKKSSKSEEVEGEEPEPQEKKKKKKKSTKAAAPEPEEEAEEVPEPETKEKKKKKKGLFGRGRKEPEPEEEDEAQDMDFEEVPQEKKKKKGLFGRKK